MKIAFHGAARAVTGTKHLITLANGHTNITGLRDVPGHGRSN